MRSCTICPVSALLSASKRSSASVPRTSGAASAPPDSRGCPFGEGSGGMTVSYQVCRTPRSCCRLRAWEDVSGAGAGPWQPSADCARPPGGWLRARGYPSASPARQVVLCLLLLEGYALGLVAGNTVNLPSTPLDEQPPKGPPALLGLRLLSGAPLASMLKGGSPW